MDLNILNQKLLLENFEYKEGHLYWKTLRPNVKIGQKAGCLNEKGYALVSIKNKLFRVHRLIYMMHHGYMPSQIDHIDGNKQNNLIENLREATNQTNSFNKKTPKNNKLGMKNISFHQLTKKYRVTLTINNKQKHIGLFDNLELAQLVAKEARIKYHGEFACHE